VSEAILIITVKVPGEDGLSTRVYTEELKLPLQRVNSDEPVTSVIDRIRERIRNEVVH